MTERHAAQAAPPPPPVDQGTTVVDPKTDPTAFATLARSFVEAFNNRDADALVDLSDPRIVFRPTALFGRRNVYHGHEGLRRWIADLDALPLDLQMHVREVRPQRPDGFLVLSELRAGDEPIADCAMIAALEAGRVVEAHGYLSDESMLVSLGLIPRAPALTSDSARSLI